MNEDVSPNKNDDFAAITMLVLWRVIQQMFEIGYIFQAPSNISDGNMAWKTLRNPINNKIRASMLKKTFAITADVTVFLRYTLCLVDVSTTWCFSF